MKKISITILISIIILGVFLSGCTTETITKYQCQDGSFKDSQELCSEVSCPEIDYSKCPQTKCPELDCNQCPVKVETKEIIKYTCPDGETTVESLDDCPTQEEILKEDEYIFTNINKAITNNNMDDGFGDLEITLVKIGRKDFGESSRFKVYWKAENKATNIVNIHPHQNTIILTKAGGQYESTLDTFSYDNVDEFHIGSIDNSGGDLRPGIITQGSVQVDNIPSSEKIVDVILEVHRLPDYEFENIKIN